jgi:D-glycero-alpha-D-manno-heptose-7-phosphate kinase
MIVVKTPHRISLFGGGTDYPAWFQKHSGEVIAGAIDKYCYLTVRELPPFFDHKYRLVYRKIETVNDVLSIEHPAVRAAIHASGMTAGLEIHHDSDLPARTGIGSSSAFSVGILQAFDALKGERPSKPELARRAIHMEREVMHEFGGHQDQVVSAHGGLINIRFNRDGSVEIRDALSENASFRSTIERNLVMVFTGVKRNSSEVAAAFVQRLTESQNDRYLYEMQSITWQAQQILDSGNTARLEELGYLLDETWRLKESMNPLAITDELRALRDEAKSAGALGGKIAGAGGGGFCVFFVPVDKREYFAEKMREHLVVPFKFVDEGSTVVYDSGERLN